MYLLNVLLYLLNEDDNGAKVLLRRAVLQILTVASPSSNAVVSAAIVRKRPLRPAVCLLSQGMRASSDEK